uniref:Eukaryotic translation initiation factor 3 subunit H n=1 Tax=Daphnia similis TaxID=35528 RepID=A0A4Y7LQ50_9CRUS|nr:EOG090X06SH [Daphnia similis]SVE71697.1 EOG090X06SH [Daphnia similis]SVE72328.1 EOG090X06SH [Daphnia similis]
MANRNRRANAPDVDNTIDLVQVDGLVVAKIIKHCHEEGSSAVDVAQGVLLGLVADTRLEVTNCFPFPKNLDENFDEEDYQMEMMRHLRKVNVDHLHVGWYQSTQQGAFLSTQFLESQFTYQTSIEESVVLIYDPLKTKRGFLHLKAYRLTPQAVALYKDNDFGADALKTHHLSFESLYQEIRLVIHNSHLVNALLCELSEMVPSYEGSQYLDLGTASVLEKHLRSLTDNVDELLQDTNKFNIYQRQVVKQQQEKQKYVQKRNLENTARQARGEAPLPDEDITKVFKPIPVPPRLEPMVLSAQIAAHCQQVSLFCSQALGKLFLSEALQQPQSSQQTVLKGVTCTLSHLREKNSGTRIIFHLGDAPPHGKTIFHDGRHRDDYENGHRRDPPLEELFRDMRRKKLMYYFGRINGECDRMIAIFERYYGEKIETLDSAEIGSILRSVTESVMRSISVTQRTDFPTMVGKESLPFNIEEKEPNWTQLLRLDGTILTYELPTSIEEITSFAKLQDKIKKCRLQIAPNPFAKGHDITDGYLLVCDLQGISYVDAKGKEILLLTDPAIHCSKHVRFGKTNLSSMGIKKFFKKHVCNKYCLALGLKMPSG